NKQFKWILNAWQFYYASGKVLYGAMRRLGQCVVHHLIGRYAAIKNFWSRLKIRSKIDTHLSA
ncbi:hypothetical protein, partial [Vibrio aestuarianus]|uniref:hypothetical protein n=1 Tax=Vibrio aestuarianus TaxID=28171 RepID=UPI0030C6C315